jgi:hypothetical protein
MAVSTDQLLIDAQCILACVPLGMVEAAQLSQLAALGQATVVTVTAIVVNTNGVKVLSANPKRRMAIVANTSPVTPAFVGTSTVTTAGATGGLEIGTFANENSRIFIYSPGELYAASTGSAMRIIEFSLP